MSMVVLGIDAAVGVVSIGLMGNHSAQPTELMSTGVRSRQARAIAEGFSRGVDMVRSQMLDEAEPAADADAESEQNATNSTPCVSWRGCRHQPESGPEDVQFECGGPVNGDICFQSVNSCVESAETSLANMYVVSPILATEARTNAVCKCFVSNGCKPACNVALYQRMLPPTAQSYQISHTHKQDYNTENALCKRTGSLTPRRVCTDTNVQYNFHLHVL